MSSENPKSANHRSSGNNAAGDDRDNTDSAKGNPTATGSGHNGSELSSMRIGTSLSSKPTWGTRLKITISMQSRMILALLSSPGILPPPSLVHSPSLCLYALPTITYSIPPSAELRREYPAAQIRSSPVSLSALPPRSHSAFLACPVSLRTIVSNVAKPSRRSNVKCLPNRHLPILALTRKCLAIPKPKTLNHAWPVRAQRLTHAHTHTRIHHPPSTIYYLVASIEHRATINEHRIPSYDQ
jgi:hypothetical protein